MRHSGELEILTIMAVLRAGKEAAPAPEQAVTWDFLQKPMDAKQIAPGVTKIIEGDATFYVVDHHEAVSFDDGAVHLEGRKAGVEVRDGRVRFLALEPTYVKLTVGNVGVRGVGPFDLTFTPDRITGIAAGRTRSIVTTWPSEITRPMYHMDGVRYYAGWADDPSIGKGLETPQFALAFGVLDGRHEVEVAEWTYPELPPAPEHRTLRLP